MNLPFPSETPPAIPDHRLLRIIGRGSYGEVWLARNTLGTPRAVKVVHRRTFESDRPFQREFDGIRRFEPISRSHEGLVQVLQVGRNDAEGFFYYVMELADSVAGEASVQDAILQPATLPDLAAEKAVEAPDYMPRTLAGEIRLHHRLPIVRCLGIGLTLTSALAHLHKAGLVHRDLKPSNIIFVGGRPKIADIGLVSSFGPSRSFVGTEGFVPPEGPGTPSADLYSLGKTLYEISTGKDRECFPEIPPDWLDLAHTSPELEFHAVVGRACEGRAADRYASAEEMHADLALLQTGRSVRQWRTIERRLVQMKRLGLVAAVLTLLALAGSWFFRHQAARDRIALARVEAAEREARRQLWNSLVAQSRAVREGSTAGHRFASLDLVRQAAAVDGSADSLVLRNEVVASLAVADMRSTRLWSTAAVTNDLALLDLEHARAVTLTRDGRAFVHCLTNQQAALELSAADAPFQQLLNISPDGRRLVAHNRHQCVQVWDIEGQRPIFTSPPLGRRVGARFASDGRRLAIFDGVAGEIAFFDVDASRPEPQPFHVVSGWPLPGSVGLRFSPDGDLIALAASGTNVLHVIETQTGTLRYAFALPKVLTAFDWQANGPLIAATCDDRKIRVWDTRHGELHAILTGHDGLAISIVFDSSGEFLASSSYDGTTRLWSLQTGGTIARLPRAGVLLNFDRTSRYLAFVPWTAREVQICEIATERVCRQLPPCKSPFEIAESGPPGGGSADDVRSTADERWLASVGQEGLRLWELATRRLLIETNIGVTASVQFEAGDDALTTVGERGVLRWPLARSGLNGQPSLGEPVRRISARRESRASWSRDGRVVAWLTGRGVLVGDARGNEREVPVRKTPTQLAVSPDGRWLATAAFGTTGATVWQLDDAPLLLREFPTRVGPSVCFTPDSTSLVVGTDLEYGFWDFRSGVRRQAIPRQDAAGISGPIAFSPDGRTMAVAATRTLIRLFDWTTGQELVTLESPTRAAIGRLNFTANGGMLAASVGDGIVEIWDLRALHRELSMLGLDW